MAAGIPRMEWWVNVTNGDVRLSRRGFEIFPTGLPRGYEEVEGTARKVRVIVRGEGGLNVRKRPSLEADRVHVFPFGTEIKIAGTVENEGHSWAVLRLNRTWAFSVYRAPGCRDNFEDLGRADDVYAAHATGVEEGRSAVAEERRRAEAAEAEASRSVEPEVDSLSPGDAQRRSDSVLYRTLGPDRSAWGGGGE